MRLPGPTFGGHLALLWGLRLRSSANVRGRLLPPGALWIVSILPGAVLAFFAYGLLRHPAVASDPVVSRFFLGLFAFIAALVWFAWPMLSAGVDDHSELSRYIAYPITRARLLLASTLAGLTEPIAFVVFGPVIGASLGFVRAQGLGLHPLVVLLAVSYLMMCAAWSRVGLYLVLRVLRSGKSAQATGTFLVLLIVAGLLLPPVDTSWLYEEGGGLAVLDSDLIANAAVAFGRVPSGYFSEGLRHLSNGSVPAAFTRLLALSCFALIGFLLASRLLGAATLAAAGSPAAQRRRGRIPFGRRGGRLSALVIREALDFVRNPRARLLIGVPFVLAVFLRVLSGRDLFLHFIGPSADTWLMAALSLYAAVLVLSTFAQNCFAYDGHGLRLLFCSPTPQSLVLLSKNIVHGVAAFSLGALSCVFYLAYLGSPGWYAVLVSLACLFSLVMLGLAGGNYLSMLFPVKFHASLQRRDKPPLAAALLGLALLGVGAVPLPLSMKLALHHGPGPASVFISLSLAAASTVAYGAMLKGALLLLPRRREAVLAAVSRE